jgi:hypothetical protein
MVAQPPELVAGATGAAHWPAASQVSPFAQSLSTWQLRKHAPVASVQTYGVQLWMLPVRSIEAP